MKFPVTTPTTKLAIKIGAGLLTIAILSFAIGWTHVAAIVAILSAGSGLAAVFLPKY